MLKVKFYQRKNVVIAEILEQGEEIKRGSGSIYFDSKNKFYIRSVEHPAIETTNALYIRGKRTEGDFCLACKSFETAKKAEEFCRKAIATIKNYNMSLKGLLLSDAALTDDFKVVITE